MPECTTPPRSLVSIQALRLLRRLLDRHSHSAFTVGGVNDALTTEELGGADPGGAMDRRLDALCAAGLLNRVAPGLFVAPRLPEHIALLFALPQVASERDAGAISAALSHAGDYRLSLERLVDEGLISYDEEQRVYLVPEPAHRRAAVEEARALVVDDLPCGDGVPPSAEPPRFAFDERTDNNELRGFLAAGAEFVGGLAAGFVLGAAVAVGAEHGAADVLQRFQASGFTGLTVPERDRLETFLSAAAGSLAGPTLQKAVARFMDRGDGKDGEGS